MTEEFKQVLFDYLTGRLPNKKDQYKEIFKEINDIPRENWVGFVPNGWNSFKYEGLIEVANSELLVLYGGYKTTNNEVRGIITILDNNFKPLKTFYQFENGTYLRYIMCMIQEGDGNFSFVDCPDFPKDEDWSFTSSQKRFIMLNNFTQKINDDYILRLQRSYIIPYKNLYCRQIYKDPNSSHYVMLCSYLLDQDSPDYDKTRIIELKINVGSENEWNYTDTEDYWILGDAYVEFDNNSNSFVELILTSSLMDSNVIATWTKEFNTTNYSYKTIRTFDYKPYIDSTSYENQSVFLNKNELYFVQNNQHWGKSGTAMSKYIGLYYYNVQTEEFKTIYEHYLGEYDYCDLEAIYLTKNNNELYIEFNDNIDSTNDKSDYCFQRLKDNKWNPIKIAEQQHFIRNQRALYINNNYNLLNIFAYVTNPRRVTWKIFHIKENYNFANYPGESYINENALIPNSTEVYSNEKFVFARNLYNRTISNNTTVSSVEIPNTYLNDIDITSKMLLSKANLNMINDTNIFRKNKYETVFLNFIDSLQIIDKNNGNDILNHQASSSLNFAVNTANQYDKMKLYNKAIIYYQDSTFKEIGYQLKKLSRLSADLILTVYVDKEVDRIEFISNNKTVIYQTIDLSNLELNKTYVIKQNLKIQDNEKNTATARGTSIHIEDSIYGQFKEFSIDGVLEQETTNGYQLFDESKLPSKTQNGTTLINNDDGSFTIDGNDTLSGMFNYSYAYSHEETIKLLKAGNIAISDDGVVGQTTVPYYFVQLRNNNGQIFEISNRITNSYSKTITQEMLDDETSFLRIGFFGAKGTNITKKTIRPMLYQEGNGEFEEFTGGKPSPNLDYPQSIEVIEGNFEVVSNNDNKDDFQESRTLIELPNDEFIGSLGNVKNQLKIEYTNDDNYHLFLYKNIKKIVLDEKFNWRTSVAATGFYRYTTTIDDTYVSTKTGPVVGKNTHFFQRINQAHGTYEYLYLVSNDSNQVGCYIQSQKFTTLAKFREWIANNHVEVYYELANTLKYDLGVIDMPYSYDEVTNIFPTSTLNPNMNITYYTDSKIKNRRRIGE